MFRFFLIVLLASAAHAADKGCSVTTLEGSFGYTVTGFRPDGGAFAAVGRLVFDGRGNLSTVRTLSSGGTIVRGDTGTGQYSIDENCMGSFNILVGGVGTLQLDIVVDDEGNQIRGIVTNPGFVLTLEGRRQGKK